MKIEWCFYVRHGGDVCSVDGEMRFVIRQSFDGKRYRVHRANKHRAESFLVKPDSIHYTPTVARAEVTRRIKEGR